MSTHDRRARTPKHRQDGLSLLEVLVSLVVLAIGLLGLAGMQIMSVKSNYSAYSRSQATLLAYDLADRARAYPRSAATILANGSTKTERTKWDDRIKAELGAEARGYITFAGNRATIFIYWDDSRGNVRPSEAPSRDPLCLEHTGLNCFVFTTELL